MSPFNLDEVTKALQGASVQTDEESGISFEGKNLKLDTEDDAKPIVDAVLACKQLGYLNLAGNTLGVDAAAALAKALEKHPEFKRALWKDLFTGRLKEEIPKALQIGTFEEIAMPQNGIYHVGITALSEAFVKNKNLEVLNLNDNTVGAKGSRAVAKALCSLQQLRSLNLGDCLLRNKGAELIAEALAQGHALLEEVNLEANEIRVSGGLAVVNAVASKPNLTSLLLDGNQFGSQARDDIRHVLQNAGHGDALPDFEDDESDASEEEEVDEDDEEEEEEAEESEEEVEVKIDANPKDDVKEVIIVEPIKTNKTITIDEFLQSPGPDNFLALGNDRTNLLMKVAMSATETDTFLDCYIPILMKVSSLAACPRSEVSHLTLTVTDTLYRELFAWAQRTQQHPGLNNALLVHLGLIKSEDKTFKPQWNVDGCFMALESALKQHYFPTQTKDTLKVFMGRCSDSVNSTLKTKLISALNN